MRGVGKRGDGRGLVEVARSLTPPPHILQWYFYWNSLEESSNISYQIQCQFKFSAPPQHLHSPFHFLR